MNASKARRQAVLPAPDLGRAFDVIFATVSLVLALPVMAIVALAILAAGGGPSLYPLSRTGLGGVALRTLKFRRTRLDELPQFLCVARQRTRMGNPPHQPSR